MLKLFCEKKVEVYVCVLVCSGISLWDQSHSQSLSTAHTKVMYHTVRIMHRPRENEEHCDVENEMKYGKQHTRVCSIHEFHCGARLLQFLNLHHSMPISTTNI